MATASPPNVQDFLDTPYRPTSRSEQVSLRMRRSQSSSAGLAVKQPTTTSPRRSIFPQNGGINTWNLQRWTPNASTTAIGRSLLDRPKLDTNSINLPENLLQNAKFSKCAASTPILHRTSTDLTLKSCLSSSNSNMSMLSRSKSSTNGFNNSSGKGGSKNEEFNLVRNVSFSHSQVRTYEATLGDNPSVSSGAPLSLGWRYDPNENIKSLEDTNESEDIGIRRSMSELRLSDRERQRRISSNPNISYTDLHSVLQSVAETRLERKNSLNELRREHMLKKQQQKNGSGGGSGRRRSCCAFSD